MTALLIKSGGEKLSITPENGVFFTLKELQSYVGGYLEMLLTNDDRTLIINEEGKLKNLEINDEATKLIVEKVIVGNVVVCDWSMIQRD
jgi:hypothetical protein